MEPEDIGILPRIKRKPGNMEGPALSGPLHLAASASRRWGSQHGRDGRATAMEPEDIGLLPRMTRIGTDGEATGWLPDSSVFDPCKSEASVVETG